MCVCVCVCVYVCVFFFGACVFHYVVCVRGALKRVNGNSFSSLLVSHLCGIVSETSLYPYLR